MLTQTMGVNFDIFFKYKVKLEIIGRPIWSHNLFA